MRTAIAPAQPAAIVAVRMGAEMLRGVHLAWPSPAGGDRRRWEGRWQSRWCLRHLLTGRTGGLTGETRKRLRVAGALARRWQRLGGPLLPSGTRVWPGRMQHDAEPEKPQEHQLVENEVRYHGKVPLTRWCNRRILPDFLAMELPARYRYTTPHCSEGRSPLPYNQNVPEVCFLRGVTMSHGVCG